MQQLAAATKTAVKATDKNDVSATAIRAGLLEDAVGATGQGNLGVGITQTSGKT
jgi:hypothetical protein